MKRVRNQPILAAAALLLAVAVAACGPAAGPGATGAPPAAEEQPALAGTSWVLATIGGQPALETTQVTLQFDNETVGGKSGCNSYGGGSNDNPYTAKSGGELTLPMLAMTMMACADSLVMDQEAAYMAALGTVSSYRVVGDVLELRNEAGETVLTFTRQAGAGQDAPPLAGTSWLLTGLRGQPLVPGTQITLDFAAETATGFAGCNGYGGGGNGDPYSITPAGELALPEMAQTAMLCLEPAGVMEQETAYIEALRAVDAYRVEGDTLALLSGGETVLTFARRPESVGDPAALIGTGWRLVAMNGVTPPEGEVWTLAFHHDGQTASGWAGCRPYVAGYDTAGGQLRLASFLAMMGPVCDSQPLLEREGTFTTILGWVDRHRLEGDRLEMLTAGGETLAWQPLPAESDPALAGIEWTLLAFLEKNPAGEHLLPAEPVPGTTLTATFQDGMVGGKAGCNTYGGGYTLDGTGLAVGPLRSTRMACLEPEGTMEQESRFLEWLSAVTGARVYAGQLWLELGDGRALVFQSPGQPPAGAATPSPAASGTLAGARDALAAYDPLAGAQATVQALRAGVQDWLDAGGDPSELAAQLDAPAGDGPEIEVQAVELTGEPPAEVVVRVVQTGLPLLVFTRDGGAWVGSPLPADYDQSVAGAMPVDTAYPWEGGQQPALRVQDLDGDGVSDLLLNYQFAGASSTTAWVSAYRWQEGGWSEIFHADLVSWAAPSAFALEPNPGGGQLIRLAYPVFLPGRYPKVGVNPRGEQVWRWDAETGRYRPGWQSVGPSRVFWPEAIASGDSLMVRGEYAAASEAYGAWIGDLDWQKEYLADYGLEGCPLTSTEVGCRELNAWLDLAQLRQGLALALDGEPAPAQEILSWIELSPDLVALAQAMIAGGGEQGGFLGALAGYERQIAAGPGAPAAGLDRPAAVYHAYQPSPVLVQRALNWLAPEELPDRLNAALAEAGAPGGPVTLADLDGDGLDEAVWLSPPPWRGLAPGETPVGYWQQAWVAWLGGSGRWQVTGIAAADQVELLDITGADGQGRRAVVLRLTDGEDAREVTLAWDGGMHMAVAPEQPEGWPVVGSSE